MDEQGHRLWRGVCTTHPDPIARQVLRHAGEDAKIGIETGSMTPWLVHGLRAAGLDVACLDARRVKAALRMRLNKTDENDAEGLAQVMRTGWYRPLHLKTWAEAIEQRSGPGKARVALARKLAVLLHSMWRSGQPFRCPSQPMPA